jgi:hypothetical protein
MIRYTLIKHWEAAMICEENGPVIADYNVLITQLEFKLITQPIVHYITTKHPPTCSNYGKIGHDKEICHKQKREEPIVLIVPTKNIELVVEIIA